MAAGSETWRSPDADPESFWPNVIGNGPHHCATHRPAENPAEKWRGHHGSQATRTRQEKERGMSEEAVVYEVVGHVATITINRPEVGNAQNTAVIDGIDHFLDVADADDKVRVVVLAGAGKHFSAGHDLKALVVGDSADPWEAMRETPEGKFRHEQTMYYERCKRLYSFRKPTIARVQGATVVAGLMLACMCDLIMAADDATFSNPVLRMTGAGVELLVEPSELGSRKAKECLWTGETM